MPIGSIFETNEPMLHELLEAVHKGEIQLPDFQRGWVWDDYHIRSLIASVSTSYPIGAVMILEMGGDGARFKPRLVEGVALSAPREPERLILDGQQRLTSLYLALRSGKAVPTTTEKGAEIQRFYYVDMTACLDPDGDRLDAVVSVPPNRMLKSDFGRQIDLDLSAREKEYDAAHYPLHLVFDTAGNAEWKMGFQEHFDYDRDKLRLLNRFEQEVWMRFQQYKVPVIELLRGTPKIAVCQVFEKVNTGGVTLSVFELMTATFAADDFQLRDDWDGRRRRLRRHAPLRTVLSTDFLTAATLLTSYKRSLAGRGAVSCKRKDVLNLALAEYTANADVIEAGMVNAARFLTREKVFDTRTLPSRTQLIPLSAICAVLGGRFEEDGVRRKLARWYWCGVLGELYGGSTETRFAMDIEDVLSWIDGGGEPRTVSGANFAPLRLLGLRTRGSAAYKGLMALLMQQGSEDFLSGDPIELTSYFDLAVDVHHIFPRDYCRTRPIEERRCNSVVNKAPITARTNRIIGGNAPSVYLAKLEHNHDVERNRLDSILRTHLVDPELLRADDFGGFLLARATRLVDMIERAMGKPVTGRDTDEVVAAFGGPLTQTAEA